MLRDFVSWIEADRPNPTDVAVDAASTSRAVLQLARLLTGHAPS
jgi:hypothetical protein